MGETFSFEEAKKFSERYQYLVGKQALPGDVHVESVAVVPYEQSSQYRFFLFYLLLNNNAQQALKHEYDGNEYDVLIIGKGTDGRILHQTLRSYVESGNQFSLTPQQFSPSSYSSSLYL